jgi:hypothetical protein
MIRTFISQIGMLCFEAEHVPELHPISKEPFWAVDAVCAATTTTVFKTKPQFTTAPNTASAEAAEF